MARPLPTKWSRRWPTKPNKATTSKKFCVVGAAVDPRWAPQRPQSNPFASIQSSNAIYCCVPPRNRSASPKRSVAPSGITCTPAARTRAERDAAAHAATLERLETDLTAQREATAAERDRTDTVREDLAAARAELPEARAHAAAARECTDELRTEVTELRARAEQSDGKEPR